MFMNRVHEQCPKIDSGKIPSRTGLKTDRVHRVLGISKRPGARGPFWARLGPMGFSPAKARKAQARPKPVKGRAGLRASFQAWPGPVGWPESWAFKPPRSPPRGPPRSLFRSPPRSPPRGPPKSPFRSPPKNPFIGPPIGPSKSPLKSPPKSPTSPCRFFI